VQQSVYNVVVGSVMISLLEI